MLLITIILKANQSFTHVGDGTGSEGSEVPTAPVGLLGLSTGNRGE